MKRHGTRRDSSEDGGRRRSRRQFLQRTGVLTFGIYLAPDLFPYAAQSAARASDTPGDRSSALPFEPNAFVRIGADSSVTVIAKNCEMGQGIYTGLATLLADELDADWSDVRVEGAPADITRYINVALGMQGTGDSTSIAGAWIQMRQAGATARALLVQAAAAQWRVPEAQISVANGVVSHQASQRHTRFGALSAAAARLTAPANPVLKDPRQFRLIGNPFVRRKDSHAKTNGSALYTQDLKLPGMLIAVAAHPPRFGARLMSFDASAARAVGGVVDVVQFSGSAHMPGGVAVLATNTWIAQRGRDALQIQWDESAASHLDSEQLAARMSQLALAEANAADAGARVALQKGDDSALQAGSDVQHEALFEVPYLAHATMEPMNCLVDLTEGGVSLWNGEQLQSADQTAIGALLDVAPANVKITQLYAGGSFGRRGNPQADYVLEAVAIAQAAAAQGHRVPIKLVWTREDDMRAGYYRPAFAHSIRASLDANGALIAWRQRSVGQSVLADSPFAGQIKDGIDPSSLEGSAEPYEIPNVRLELITLTDVAVPVQWWRSVGHSHTAFATECMIDELAIAAGVDPYQFRRGLLASHPRQRAVLDLAAARAGWGSALPAHRTGERRGRGIALHESFGTSVAQVAEVSVEADGTLHVNRVVCAVDCGIAINPNVITAQMQGGIGFGLSAALYGAVTLKDGVVQQSNFDAYRCLRPSEMPLVEVYIVPSHEAPSGVGGPGTPPIAPAVVNAIFQATGQRLRRLPLAGQIAAASD
ncbi:MAG TPA: xanthine dehydrogenase family protein molybdopterin-binding subunit [Steroidobacteraceae bacterium]|nr:xanthine dehydrogenase family protein molybdopterin-binding subunit [Steroidobacteraceae bacterium]